MFRRLDSYSGGKFAKGVPLTDTQKAMMAEARKKARLEKLLLVQSGQASDIKEAAKLRKKMLKDKSKKYEDVTENLDEQIYDKNFSDFIKKLDKKKSMIAEARKKARLQKKLSLVQSSKNLDEEIYDKNFSDFIKKLDKQKSMMAEARKKATLEKKLLVQSGQASDMKEAAKLRKKMLKVPKGGALVYPTNLNHDVGSGGSVSTYHKSNMKEFKKVPLEVVRELHRRAGFKKSHLKKHAVIASDLMAGGYFWDDIWDGIKTVASDLWSGLKTVGTETWEQAIKPATADIYNQAIKPNLADLGKKISDTTAEAYKAKVMGLGIRKRVPKTHRLTYKF